MASKVILYWPGHWASPETIDFHALVCTVCPQYLSLREVSDIIDQLSGEKWLKDKQILWSGVPFEEAQTYAKNHNMQTLTIAMGPLMDKGDPACLKRQKSLKEWSNYVRGASLIFSWRINTSGKVTTLLVPPPPTRFNPSKRTSFQEIEEPVIKGLLSPQTVDRIMVAHPTVKEAGDLTYQYWPVDEQENWIKQYGIEKEAGRKWRKVNLSKACPQWAISAIIHGKPELRDDDEYRSFNKLVYACLVGVVASLLMPILFGTFIFILAVKGFYCKAEAQSIEAFSQVETDSIPEAAGTSVSVRRHQAFNQLVSTSKGTKEKQVEGLLQPHSPIQESLSYPNQILGKKESENRMAATSSSFAQSSAKTPSIQSTPKYVSKKGKGVQSKNGIQQATTAETVKTSDTGGFTLTALCYPNGYNPTSVKKKKTKKEKKIDRENRVNQMLATNSAVPNKKEKLGKGMQVTPSLNTEPSIRNKPAKQQASQIGEVAGNRAQQENRVILSDQIEPSSQAKPRRSLRIAALQMKN